MVVIDHLLVGNKKSVLGCEARHTLVLLYVPVNVNVIVAP